ncbi:DUF2339 domain-containing protein [Novosphingobium guangzhouense]|uniref:DUF2339 domain-containing protein n=1 Tax=Novosphingobium guangzhouense TaxID=1850347 RepID=A0A2K2FU28_9SPHN|nr:DUF2339 domain-containing protein [Novosphingobium guangzhouense]PNU02268.1 hypothetical protein A8V01_09660 [Novosphingobium guangzhouense]
MTGILLLATIILGALLYDTRRRLIRVEGLLAEPLAPAYAGPEEPVQQAHVEAETPPAPDLELDPVAEFVPVAPEPMPFAEEVEPEPASATEVEDKPASSGFGFEDLFGRRLPIWAGGITLIVAAVLMVKYSIDTGLLSPVVRVAMGLLFSGALIGLGELARRRENVVRDARVAQALVGAGVGGLYAAVLAAANLYDLIGSGTAFVGLTAITAFALGLALRFGAPCAVLGLVGGLATPAVVQSQSPSVPLLAGYLAVVIGAITLLSRRQRWVWLGIGALTGGAGWTLLTIAMGDLDSGSTLAMGLLVLLLGLGLPALAVEGRTAPILRGVTGVVGALQLALIIARGEFAPLTWGLYGLLSLAFVWLAGRTPVLRRTVAVPLLTALGLVAVWPTPGAGLFASVVAGITAIYGGYALWRVWREDGSLVEVGLLGAIALGGYVVCFGQFYAGHPGQDLRFALLALAFSAVPMLGAGLGWRNGERGGDARFALLSCCSGVLVALAGLVGLPEWCAPMVIATVAATLLGLSVMAQDQRVAKGALGFLVMAVIALVVTIETTAELARLFEVAAVPHPARAVLRWSLLCAVTAAFAWRNCGTMLRFVLQPVAAVLGYGLVAQIVPAPWLAVVTSAALIALVEAGRRRQVLALEPTWATVAGLLALWALQPIGHWLLAGMMSLGGNPVYVGELPSVGMAIGRLVVPAIAGAFMLWRMPLRLTDIARMGGAALTSGLALIGAHVLYKQLFAIGDYAAFVRLGLAERCLWETVLMAAGTLAWRYLAARRIAIGLVLAGMAHNLVYTVALHDPLWAKQAVGAWPLANLLLPAFGITFLGVSILERIVPEFPSNLRRVGDGLRMALVLLFAFATLRQLFAGSVLVLGNVTELENIGRSVLAIVLAVGFLLWGIRKGLSDWRLTSLVLMLGAAGKVFLIDASGLQGLLRIASFLALGFSLIGIGWLHNRYRN